MEDDTNSWRPNWRALVNGGYKEAFKFLVVGMLGILGILFAKGLPVVGVWLREERSVHHYQMLLFTVCSFALGFSVDRFVLWKRIRALSEETTKDDLTGLSNLRAKKRAVPVAMKAAFERLKAIDSNNRPIDSEGLCAILLDIDNFKQVNDTTSYDSGNFVLQQFAELLNNNRKVTDQVFRLGGDEFLIIAPRTPRQGAVMYAEKLRNTVASTKFKVHRGRADVPLTISAGVASMLYPENDTSEALIKRANDALLRAKRTKNCVELS